jgi:hypothetical protein
LFRRPLISWLSIALLAMDAVVGAVGHSHADPGAACTSHADHQHACGHHHAGDPPRSDDNDHEIPVDDCSLCRHFSQPVAVATITVELAGRELIEPLVISAEVRRIASATKRHTARGPPSVCA